MHLRIDSSIRLKNVMTILRYVTKNTNARVIVMEADSIQHGRELNGFENMSYIYVQDNDPIFHFTRYRNELIRTASTPIVALWDADAIVPLNQMLEAIEKIRNGEAVMSWPYDGIYYNVPQDVAELFETMGDIDILTSRKNDFSPMFGALSNGGLFFVNRDKYMEIGMDNENIRGWGPEDAERLKRVSILGLPVYRVRGELYHLWHPRGINSGHVDPQKEAEGCKEFLKICQCSREELLAYIQSWEWVGSN